MSIDLNPNLYAYQAPPDVCPLFFGANTTPDKLFVNFTGILRGDDWAPPDGDPPNGTWEIVPDAPCHYQAVIDGHTVLYSIKNVGSGVAIATPLPRTAFIGDNPAWYHTWFANTKVGAPGNHFYGGFASVTTAISNEQSNLIDIWESLGECVNRQTFATPRAKSGTETVLTYSRGMDRSNVKILSDNF